MQSLYKYMYSNNFNESAKLRDLRAKNVLTCQRALHAYVPTCLAFLRAHVPTCFACSRANVLVLTSLLSVSLPLLLKLHRLLIRFKSLITVFPQQREFIYQPSLLIMCRLKGGNIREMLINYWGMLVSQKLLHQSGVVFRRVKNVWRKKPWENVQCILVLKLYSDFFVLLFHFHQF